MRRFTICTFLPLLLLIAGGCVTVRPPEIAGLISETKGCVWPVVRDGAVWSMDFFKTIKTSGVLLTRIDPRTIQVTASIPVGAPIFGFAVGEGAVWVHKGTTPGGFIAPFYRGHAILKIDPRTNKIINSLSYPPASSEGHRPAIAAGGGAVWAVGHGPVLLRIDPSTLQIVEKIPIRGGGSGNWWKLAFGEGAVWALQSEAGPLFGPPRGVSRFDPLTNREVAWIPIPELPQARFSGIIVPGAGAVWVEAPTGAISRIDPRGNQVSATVRVTEDSRILSVAAGEDSIWVAFNKGSENWIAEIDAKTNQIVRSIPFGSGPAIPIFGVSLAVGESALWACSSAHGIWRIPLPSSDPHPSGTS